MNPLHEIHVAYRWMRRRLHVRLVADMRAKPEYRPRIHIPTAPRQDDRSSIELFRRMNRNL